MLLVFLNLCFELVKVMIDIRYECVMLEIMSGLMYKIE